MTGDHQQHDQQPERFEELVGRFDHAMLVSVAEDLSLHARPMAIADCDGARLRFATSNQSAKAAEVTRRPHVAVVMQGEGTYLTVSGTASIVVERERIGELWRPAWKLWFPEGPQDPSLLILEIEAERAEYWDRTGKRRLEFLWEAGKALASGHRLDDDKLSGHHKFSFG
jgi:general stress protein 26